MTTMPLTPTTSLPTNPIYIKPHKLTTFPALLLLFRSVVSGAVLRSLQTRLPVVPPLLPAATAPFQRRHRSACQVNTLSHTSNLSSLLTPCLPALHVFVPLHCLSTCPSVWLDVRCCLFVWLVGWLVGWLSGCLLCQVLPLQVRRPRRPNQGRTDVIKHVILPPYLSFN